MKMLGRQSDFGVFHLLVVTRLCRPSILQREQRADERSRSLFYSTSDRANKSAMRLNAGSDIVPSALKTRGKLDAPTLTGRCGQTSYFYDRTARRFNSARSSTQIGARIPSVQGVVRVWTLRFLAAIGAYDQWQTGEHETRRQNEPLLHAERGECPPRSSYGDESGNACQQVALNPQPR